MASCTASFPRWPVFTARAWLRCPSAIRRARPANRTERALLFLLLGTVDVEPQGAYTMYPDGYPDFPMAQLLETRHTDRRVTVSCMVSDLRFEWRLEASGAGTQITVEVEIPEHEAQRLDSQREKISASLARLAELAAAS